VVVAYRVVVLTDMGGQEVAGGAVPVGNGGVVTLDEAEVAGGAVPVGNGETVLLDEAPVLRAMDAPPVEDGRRVNP
jgi:hypothetical protein